MMRIYRIAAIAAFVWIPVTRAATMVWFETPNTHGNGGGAGPAGGAPGLPLNLWCDTSAPPGVCTWQIQMRAALGTGGITGWSLDLRTEPGNGVSIANPQIPPGTPFNDPSWPGTGGSGLALLSGAAGQTFLPIQPQTLTLLTFTLRRTFQTGDLSFRSIFGGPSSNDAIVWYNVSTDNFEIVQFGPNPPAPAEMGRGGPLQLILMNTIPEPASLTLLALGAAVSLRRRSLSTKRSIP